MGSTLVPAAIAGPDDAIARVLRSPIWLNPRAPAILEGLRARGRDNDMLGIEMGLLSDPEDWIDRGIAWLREIDGEPLDGALSLSASGAGIDWNIRAEELPNASSVVAEAMGLQELTLHLPERVRELASALHDLERDDALPPGTLEDLREAYAEAAQHGWAMQVG